VGSLFLNHMPPLRSKLPALWESCSFLLSRDILMLKVIRTLGGLLCLKYVPIHVLRGVYAEGFFFAKPCALTWSLTWRVFVSQQCALTCSMWSVRWGFYCCSTMYPYCSV
jgi:hypothetical protein